MSLDLTLREIGDVVIVDCRGRITLNDGAIVLRNAFVDLIARGKTKVVLNMANVGYVDSSGLGELFAGFTTIKERGGNLKLLAITKTFRDLLQVTHLHAVFSMYFEEADAVRSFL
jgi:anti-sigma B factor antagonist